MIRSPRAVEEQVLRTLSEYEPITALQYAEITGLAYNAAWDRLRRLWDAKIIHIVGWIRGRSGRHKPLYGIGPALDAEPLATFSLAEKVKRYQASEKGKAAQKKAARRRYKREKVLRQTDPAWAEQKRAYGREWARKKHGHQPRRHTPVAVEKIDPLMAALMGIKPKRQRRKGGAHA